MTLTRRTASTPSSLAHPDEDCILVLQGGGALGAYQAGVFESLGKVYREPTWVAGISIGAINAALIAGNPAHTRVARLREFWELVSSSLAAPTCAQSIPAREGLNEASASQVMLFGVPGFFKPRFPPAPFQPRGSLEAISYYDTTPLKSTLERLVDFDRINSDSVRLSVGAVNVRNGNFEYFDSAKQTIDARHIMASGALPPAFPSIRIEGEYYWDGGIVSNTPLQYLLDQEEDRSSLVFQVDLFSARGVLPRSMPDVLSRHKDIMYSSRTRQNTDNFKRIHSLKMRLLDALKRVPKEQLTPAEEALIADYSDAGIVNIVHLIYQHKGYEGHAKDYEFSGTSMREHWQSGYEDTRRTLLHRYWLEMPAQGAGCIVHDVHRESD